MREGEGERTVRGIDVYGCLNKTFIFFLAACIKFALGIIKRDSVSDKLGSI